MSKNDSGKLWVKVIIVTFWMQLATVYVLAASNNDERLVDTRTVDFCKTKVIVSFKENREFNKRRF